ncbi:MAG: D-tyrosyl-tRNA(Tyr) deacylase [Lachnospiraceae bacterium]|nr:D-tyrosyl-tRNA(Tyr) deacylase [Lachnospiraceae bacterium]
MKAVIQRVIRAAVRVDGVTIGEIGRGYLVLLGVADGDGREEADRILRKMVNLRIFPDEAGKINLSLGDVDGQLLIVSQFTLCADTSRGNRPSFVYAAPPEKANEMYEYFIAKARECVPVVQTGSFGADMKVELVNDGPFTIILE